jgi:hypothetical protein
MRPTMRTGRWARDVWLGAAVLFLLTASFMTFFGWNGLRVDATAYWQAATALRTGGPLYAAGPVAALDKAYLYPPAFAAVFAPLTLLPTVWGYAVWMALLVLSAAALARVAGALAGIAPEERSTARTALALALAALLVPVFDNLAEGQVNLVIALLVTLAVCEVEIGRDARAAFALAAATHVKLVPIVLAGAFVVWRRPRLLAWLALALVLVGLLPLPWRVAGLGVGPGITAFVNDYVDFGRAILWPAASAQRIAGVEQLFAPNFSLRGTLARLFVAGTPLSPFPADAARQGPLLTPLAAPVVQTVATAGGIVALLVALLVCWRGRGDRARRIAGAGLVLGAGALTGPSFWQHHFVILVVAGAGLWRMLADRPPRTRAVVWTLALLPLVVTVTLPFFVALVTGVQTGGYRALREWGAPTGAVLVFLAVVAATALKSRPAAARP